MKIRINHTSQLPAIILLLLAICSFSCRNTVDEIYRNVIFVTGTENDPQVKFVVEDLPSSYAVTVSASAIASNDQNIVLKVDTGLIEKYNEKVGATYYPVPAKCYQISGLTTTIRAGRSISEPISVSIISVDGIEAGKNYVIPVTIAESHGGMAVLESSRTIFLKVARSFTFNSMETSTMRNGLYPINNPIAAITTYTWEVKCYPYAWHSNPTNNGGERISRVAGWGTKDQNMLRFGEGNDDPSVLQVSTKQGKLSSKTMFALNQWYMISVVNDGSTISLYINGVLDGSFTVTPYTYTFQDYEIGISDAGYETKQKFQGRVSEMRLWDRALTTNEINNGLCGTNPAAAGLLGYWKVNEGSGNVLYDASGQGRDIDLTSTPIKWVFDDKNKCAQ